MKNKDEIKNYYQDKKVAKKYIEKRFKSPIYSYEHKTQIKFINDNINQTKSENVLEIACGPGRITSEIKVKKGIAIDSSDEMIKIATKRIKNKNWKITKKDAFNLNFKTKFDLIFTFRFLFHFKKDERKKLIGQIKNNLKKDGYLIFEALNKNKVTKIRTLVEQIKLKQDNYPVYDKLYQKKELVTELETAGFKIITIKPIVQHFWTQIIISKIFELIGMRMFAEKLINKIDTFNSKNPMQWLIICQKK